MRWRPASDAGLLGDNVIVWDQGVARFNFRVAGVAIRDGQVLLHRGERDSYWSLPGGRAELLESTEETLRREMLEELGIAARVERLLWVVENFFTLDARKYHELSLYFLMTLPPEVGGGETRFYGEELEPRFIYEWHPLDGLGELALPLKPSFLYDGLPSLPEVPAHLVHRDEAQA